MYCIVFYSRTPVYLLNSSILAAHVHPHVGEGAASRQEVGGDGDVVRDPHADVLIRGLRESIAILGGFRRINPPRNLGILGGLDFGLLASCRGEQIALKCSCRSDRV